MGMNRLYRVTLAALMVAIGLIILLLMRQCSNGNGKSSTFVPGFDSAEIWRDELQRMHARVDMLELQHLDDALKIQAKDSLTKYLQEVIRKEKENGRKQGKATAVAVAEVSGRIDTVLKARVDTATAVASSRYPHWDTVLVRDEWTNGAIRILSDGNVDSVGYDIRYTNRYSAVVRREGGFFKEPRYHLELMSENPNVTITDARSIRVEFPKERRFGIGPMVGVGVSYDGKIHPIVGIGLQWNLIRF